MIVLLASGAMFVAVLGLSRMASSTDMTLLYAGLESSAAGEVLTALDARGVKYDVRNGSIFVEAAQRDTLRMTLASEGLPANSGKGYELLDGLSGFGTTSQMFDAAYWRAKEGELARTIVASPDIKSARVHIANVAMQGFRQRSEATASVTVVTASGVLGSSQVRALKFLVASAVPGLQPESVSVIDSRSGLMGDGAKATTGAELADRTELLKQKVERLLEARVGFGNAVVEVNLETVTEQQSIHERRFDPDSRVAISTDTTETNNSANDSNASGVTVASNLPEGDAAASGGNSASQNSESRERVNYEVSETTREIIKIPGETRRLTVAVLVDGFRTEDQSGAVTWQPRPESELESLKELVAGAVGFDPERGDRITIKTMEFEPLPEAGDEVAAGGLSQLPLDLMSLLKMAVLAAVALVLGLFVVRPVLLSAPSTPALDSSGAPALPGVDALDLSGDGGAGELPVLASEPGFAPPMATVADIAFDDGTEPDGASDPVSKLRNLIAERQSETVEILRGWMEDDREVTR